MLNNNKIREFIIENFLFGVPDNRLGDEDSLLEKGILDSTGVMELVAFLEETYEILVEDEELDPENLDSIGRIEAYVERKRGVGNPAECPGPPLTEF